MPTLLPGMTFDEVCRAALAFLAAEVPMGYWSVSRHIAGQQLYLDVIDEAYGKVAGDSHAWSDSFCQHMVTGAAPQIAPDAMDVPKYAAAGVAQTLRIGSYIGIPIETEDGTVFGTICGLDPAIKTPQLFEQASTLRDVSKLLAQFLDDDRLATEVARDAEQARARLAADAFRMVDQAIWEATLEREAPRIRRFGDCAAVLIIAVDASTAAQAAEVLAARTRAADVVAVLETGGFGILARDVKPEDTPKLIARLEECLAEVGIRASVVHRDISVKEGLSAAWQDVRLSA